MDKGIAMKRTKITPKKPTPEFLAELEPILKGLGSKDAEQAFFGMMDESAQRHYGTPQISDEHLHQLLGALDVDECRGWIAACDLTIKKGWNDPLANTKEIVEKRLHSLLS
jgi:hypothetical protein